LTQKKNTTKCQG